MFWLGLATATFVAAAPVAPATLGPFRPSPALAIYLISEGPPCPVSLVARLGDQAVADRLMVRQFDPDEKLIAWRYQDPAGPPAASPQAGDPLLEMNLALPARAGVHQIRLTCGSHNTEVILSLARALPYGVLGQSGRLRPWSAALREAFLYVPPRAEKVILAGGPCTVSDAGGKALAALTTEGPRAEIDPVTPGAVYRVRFPDPTHWSLAGRGFPLILCDSEDSARAIHGSIEQLQDGTVVAHRFQREAARILHDLLAPEKVGRAEDLIVPLRTREAEWLKDPVRSAALLNDYGMMEHVPQVLRDQNVDPHSPWGGSIRLWKEKAGQPDPENRPDRYGWEKLGYGLSPIGFPYTLGVAATLDAPFNPYFGQQEILNRAAAAALRDLMALDEDETFKQGDDLDMDAYPGTMGFALAQRHLPVFACVAPRLLAEIRQVWTEGLRHAIDRHLPLNMVSCRNQSSHYLLTFWHFAEGSGDPQYRDLALAYGRRFLASAHRAGWFEEACGPDASYQGMTHWHLGYYARLSGDPAVLEALRTAYRFFNHTVAPEPGGAVEGATNFSHRTADSFAMEQYGGTRGIASDLLPEVGLWTPEDPQGAATAERIVRERLAAPYALEWYQGANVSRTSFAFLNLPRYLYGGQPPKRGVLPAAEPGPFFRNLGDELVAVKRPAYYAVVYVGHPVADPFYILGREAFRKSLRGEDTGGEVDNHGHMDVHQVTPFLGGGLSLFQTPEYGNLVMARNWSPVTHHGLIATLNDGRRMWEDYMASRFEIPVGEKELVVSGQVEGIPLAYTRHYIFEEDRLRIRISLTAEEVVALAGLVENLPICLGSLKVNGADLSADGEKEGRAETTGATVRDRDGKGVRLALDKKRSLRLFRQGLSFRQVTIGRIEIALPTRFASGQKVALAYALEPVK